jgi:hypothetical protein
MVFGGANLAYGVFAADRDRTYWWVTMSGYACIFLFGAVQLVRFRKPRTVPDNMGSDA